MRKKHQWSIPVLKWKSWLFAYAQTAAKSSHDIFHIPEDIESDNKIQRVIH